jgi:hypothetical protein
VRPRGHHQCVQKILADLLPEPDEVLDVVIADDGTELDLDRHHTLIGSLHDEVHLASTAVEAKVLHACLRGLRVDADAEGDERLEEVTEERAAARDRGAVLPAAQQRIRVQTQDSDGERRVRQMVLRGLREPGEKIS